MHEHELIDSETAADQDEYMENNDVSIIIYINCLVYFLANMVSFNMDCTFNEPTV